MGTLHLREEAPETQPLERKPGATAPLTTCANHSLTCSFSPEKQPKFDHVHAGPAVSLCIGAKDLQPCLVRKISQVTIILLLTFGHVS